LLLNEIRSGFRFKPSRFFKIRKPNTRINGLKVIFEFLEILEIPLADNVSWHNSEVVHNIVRREETSSNCLVALNRHFQLLRGKVDSLQ